MYRDNPNSLLRIYDPKTFEQKSSFFLPDLYEVSEEVDDDDVRNAPQQLLCDGQFVFIVPEQKDDVFALGLAMGKLVWSLINMLFKNQNPKLSVPCTELRVEMKSPKDQPQVHIVHLPSFYPDSRTSRRLTSFVFAGGLT